MFAVNGLYGHIQRNNLKSAALLTGFVLLIALFWFAWCLIYTAVADVWWPANMTPWTFRQAAPAVPTVQVMLAMALARCLERWWVSLVFSSLWFVAAYLMHADLIRAGTRARALTRKENGRLYNIVENLAISAGLPMPRVEIMRTQSLNAYAAGLSANDAVIAVTHGLLGALTDEELEAVLAHEITHIKNTDVRLMVIAAVFAGGLTLVGDLLGRAAGGARSPKASEAPLDLGLATLESRDKEPLLPVLVGITIAVLLLAATHVLAIMTQFALSRSREFLADAGAVELTKNPEALISALSKISGQDEMTGLNRILRAMMFSASSAAWFSTHPPVEQRISALRDYAAGRVHRRSPRRSNGGVRSTVGERQAKAGLFGSRAAFGRRISRA